MYKNLSPGAVGISGETRQIMQWAKEAGFEGVDLNAGEAARSPEAVKDLYAEFGLRVGGFGLPVDFRKDEDTFSEGLAKLPALAAAAQAVGCTRCPTWITPASDELDFSANFEQHRRRLKACAEILKDHDIWLGLEFVGPKTSRAGKRYEFIWNMKGMLELAEAIGTGNVGLLLDAWHWYTSHGTVDELKALRGEQVVYIHVNDAPEGVPVDEQIDNVRRLPGATGVIDIGAFLRCMDEIGCTAPVTAEPFSPELNQRDNAEAARLVAASLDKIFQVAGLR